MERDVHYHMQRVSHSFRFKRIFTAIVAAAVCLSAAFTWSAAHPQPVAARSVSEIQADQDAIQSKLDDVNGKISDLQGQIDSEEAYQAELSEQISLYQQQIALMDEQIGALEDQIEEKNAEIETLQTDIASLDEEIAAKQVEIDETYALFKERMVALYQAGETSSLAMLLSSDSFADFVTNVQLMQAVSESDQQLVEKLRTQKEEQQAQKDEKEAAEAEVQAALTQIQQDEEQLVFERADQQSARESLEAAYAESKTAMQDLEAMKANYEANREEIEAEEAAVEAELQQLYASMASSSSSSSSGSSSSGSSSNVIVDTGDLSFRWPLPGYTTVTSGYGARWGTTHTGIDISGGGCYGSPIVAAESGTVILCQWYSTYGQCIIVDHGGGYSTLYAHMSAYAVSTGDYVTKGQTIGYVGDTGNVTGPHLHFEVRINGATQNPLNYVSP